MKKRKPNRWLFYVFLVLAFFSAQTFVNRALVSGAAPDIQATTVDGQAFALSQFGGQPALIYFWASWCGICETMRHSINAIADDYPVMTLAVQSGDATEIKHYMEAHQINIPVMLDRDGAIGRRYGIRGVPAAFILGPDREIRFSTVGYTTELGLRVRLWLTGVMG